MKKSSKSIKQAKSNKLVTEGISKQNADRIASDIVDGLLTRAQCSLSRLSDRGTSPYNQQTRDANGKYNHNLDRMCVCGRSKGDHLAERPYPMGDDSCERFRRAK